MNPIHDTIQHPSPGAIRPLLRQQPIVGRPGDPGLPCAVLIYMRTAAVGSQQVLASQRDQITRFLHSEGILRPDESLPTAHDPGRATLVDEGCSGMKPLEARPSWPFLLAATRALDEAALADPCRPQPRRILVMEDGYRLSRGDFPAARARLADLGWTMVLARSPVAFDGGTGDLGDVMLDRLRAEAARSERQITRRRRQVGAAV